MAKIRELSSLIYLKYDREIELARDLGWTRQRLNKITNGKKEPNLEEAAALAEKLGVNLEDIANIFLRLKSPNGQRVKMESV